MTLESIKKVSIGSAELYLGDAWVVLDLLPPKSVDVTFTSPPFYDRDLGFGTSKKICEHQHGSFCRYYNWYKLFLAKASRVTKNWIVVFNSAERMKWIHRYSDPLYTWQWIKAPSQFRNKSNPIFIYQMESSRKNILSGAWSTVYWDRPLVDDYDEGFGKGFTVIGAPVRKSEHPYEDPVKVYHEFLYIFSKVGCKSVLDPFVGRGTTIEACSELGMKSNGIEINPEYFDMAVRRLSSGKGFKIKDSYKKLRSAQPTLFAGEDIQ